MNPYALVVQHAHAVCSRLLVIQNRIQRSILVGGIMPASLLLVASASAKADSIFTPGDQILGGQEDTGTSQFLIGVGNGTAGTNSWPNNESPDHAIDGVAAKYLNFGVNYTGLLVNPSFNGGNGSVVSSIQLWTANDAVQRDPANYEIWGTNTALDFSGTTTAFALNQFTLISSGALSLPSGRGGTGTTALNNTNSQTISFTNNTGYKEYLIVFPTVKNSPTAANSMQIGEVQLFGIAAYTELKWDGSVNNTWNVNTTQNWSVGGSPSTFSNTNGVMFDDSSTGSTSISIQNGGTAVQPAAVVFANNSKNYTISGDAISSSGNLLLGGTGSVTLNNANNFALGTTVNAGTLNIGASGSLGSGPLNVNNPNTGAGTAVVINFNSAQSIGSLAGSLATPSSGVNTATINLNGTLTVNQTTEGVYAGVIAGTGGLTKGGPGALTLTGVNTYSGPTIINGGILRSSAPGDNEQGALPEGQPVTVNSGATLLFGADDGVGYYTGSVSSITVNGGMVLGAASTHSTLPSLTLNGGAITAADAGNFSNGSVLNYILDGDLNVQASGTPSSISANSFLLRKAASSGGPSNPVGFNISRGTGATDLVVSSVVKDQGAGLIKSGSGILTLTNSNTYSGPTVINAGKIEVNDSTALGTGTVTINSGSTLALGADTTNGFAGFSLNGGATVDGSNSVLELTANSAGQTHSVFSSTPLSIANGFTTSFLYTAGGNRQADGFTFTIQNSSPSAIGGGGGGLAYLGIANSAAVEFNIYTGSGAIGTNYAVGTTGGYISSAPVSLSNGNPIAITLSYNPTAQTLTETLFDLVTRDSYTNTFNGVDFASAIGGTSGYVGFTGATGGLTASQTIANFSFNNYAQGVSLANNLSIPASATVGLEITPVALGGAGSASLSGAFTLGSNATLNISGGATATNTPFTLTTTGTTTIAGNTTINVANNGTGKGALLLADVAEQTPGAILTKTGNGTLTILGATSYTGNTLVNGGILDIEGSLSGSTKVNNGGTLVGIGTLTSVNVASGGTIAPGNSIGTLTTGPLSLDAGAAINIEVGTLTADQIKINGGATLSGTINLAISLLFDPMDGTTYTILDGSAALVGYGSGARLSYLGLPLSEGQQFTVIDGILSQTFQISYTANAGQDLVLIAVPEPSSATALVIGSVIAACGLRRRRPTRNTHSAAAHSSSHA